LICYAIRACYGTINRPLENNFHYYVEYLPVTLATDLIQMDNFLRCIGRRKEPKNLSLHTFLRSSTHVYWSLTSRIVHLLYLGQTFANIKTRSPSNRKSPIKHPEA
jgi:hypothetical protein